MKSEQENIINKKNHGITSTGLKLTVESLKEMAAKKTQLHDWGDTDFHYPLSQLLNFFKEEYGEDAEKTLSFGYTIIDTLAKRLYIQDNINSFPGILSIPIERPLFITGLPRTGTTLMHHLISRDPIWRVFLYWELLYPYRQPGIANFERYAIRQAEKGLKALYSLRPELIYRHETKAKNPEECFNLIRLSFYSIAWANEWYLGRYLAWFLQQDMTGGYRYYRKLLQLLLWRKKGTRLLLKCPAHLFTIDALFNVFPNANVIWMHRNPCESIASGLSLLSVFHDINAKSDEFITLYLGYFKKSLEKAMEIKKTGTGQLKSISYKALIHNPLGIIIDIYDQFGYPWDNEKEKNILKWLAENPRHKHGVHRYNLEKFGLSTAEIENRFSRYFDEYGDLI